MTPKMIQPNITFTRELDKRASTQRVVVHHSVSAPMTTAEQIHGWHLAKGWAGIGYHFVITGDGTIYIGRPIDTIGAHTFNGNMDSIGVCLCGNFEEYAPAEVQIAALVSVVEYAGTLYGEGLITQRHGELNATACPGRLFPWADFLRRLVSTNVDNLIQLAKDNHLIIDDHDPDDVADKRFVLTVGLNLINELGGKKNG